MVIFILSYFGLVIGLRSVILYNKTKIDATRKFGKENQTKRAERFIQAALLLLIIIGINYSCFPSGYTYLMPIEVLEMGWLQTTGFILSMLGLVLTFIAQMQMKNSWRLGIDRHEDVELITSGLFSVSRNPVYLGLGISFLGFFLIAPNVVSIVFLLLISYGVNEKIKDEEAFLYEKFGNTYELYKSRVRKWI